MMFPLIRKEMLDALRNRWIIGYAVLIAVLGYAAALVGARSTGGMALQMFGRTTATLTNLSLLLAPLVALVVGAASIAGERDRGTLSRLLSLPITPTEVLFAKFCALLLALFAATVAGFAPAAVMVTIYAGASALGHFLLFPFVTLLLIAAMTGIGLLLSLLSRTGVQALGSAILVWFGFVLLYDLLLIGTLSAAQLPPAVLAALLVANPIDAARVLVVLLLEPDLYSLGPAGIILISSLSRAGAALVLVASLLFWSIAPLLISVRLFRWTLFGRRTRDKEEPIVSSVVYVLAPTNVNPINE
jgi:Cu-processing system permease protein